MVKKIDNKGGSQSKVFKILCWKAVIKRRNRNQIEYFQDIKHFTLATWHQSWATPDNTDDHGDIAIPHCHHHFDNSVIMTELSTITGHLILQN